MSEIDKTIRWFSADGLQPLYELHHSEPTAIARRADTDAVIIGNRAGAVWSQPFQSKVNAGVRHFFTEPVVSLFNADDGSVLAAGISGRAARIDLASGDLELIWKETGFQRQKRILPAGKAGIFWSICERQKAAGTKALVSLVLGQNIVLGQNREEIVFTGLILDIAVSSDGTTLCIASELVKIIGKGLINDWKTLYHRDEIVKKVAFLNDELIAVVLGDESGSRFGIWPRVYRL